MPDNHNPSADRCPQCGAAMRPVWIGELKDKFLECEHCRSRVDVLDEVTIEEESREHGHDHRGRRVETSRKRTVHRRDLPTGGGQQQELHVDEAAGPDTPIFADGQGYIEIDLGDRDATVGKLEEYLREALPADTVIDIDPEELIVQLRELGSEHLFVQTDSLQPTGENKIVTATEVVTHTVVDDVESSITSSALRRPTRPKIPLSVFIIAAVVAIIVLVMVLG